MTLGVALQLARASNLPTVWTQVIAAVYLAWFVCGSTPPLAQALVATLLLLLAASSVYTAGMMLNDVFDRDYDARHRPERPIPAGICDAAEVSRYGFFALGLGVVSSCLAAVVAGHGLWPTLLVVAALCLAVLAYDLRHRGHRSAAFIMGGCRALVYALAFVVVFESKSDFASASAGSFFARGAQFGWALLLPCVSVFVQVVGLTRIAAHESGPGGAGPLPIWPKLAIWLAAASMCLLPRSLGLEQLPPLALIVFAGQGLWIHRSLAWLRPEHGREVGRCIVGLIAGLSLTDAVILATVGQSGAAICVLLCFCLTRWLQSRIRGD